MRAVVQRVLSASVRVDGEVVGEIEGGLLVFAGIGQGDGEGELQAIARKIARLRIFSDENDRMNLNVQQIGGKVLAVSQFTLYGDVRKGTRPSFTSAQPPDLAREQFQTFCKLLEADGLEVEQGRFGADMKVELLNDGPVTILLDSSGLF